MTKTSNNKENRTGATPPKRWKRKQHHSREKTAPLQRMMVRKQQHPTGERSSLWVVLFSLILLLGGAVFSLSLVGGAGVFFLPHFGGVAFLRLLRAVLLYFLLLKRVSINLFL